LGNDKRAAVFGTGPIPMVKL